jgi:hypothetical protein
MPVWLHAAATNNRTPTVEDFGHLPRISPSLPHPFRPTRTYALSMGASATERRPGSAPATIAAVIAFCTCALYIVLIFSQGEVEIVPVIVVVAYIAALGACALVGAMRTRPDRVIPLGVASGGLIGAAIISLFSIGILLLVAGVFALFAWMRAGVGASARDQLLGGVGGVVAALVFAIVLLAI